ncbi:MAG: vWA domain-containing protein [Thermodesulfobacteriota bacterium]|nr:vWA domain-containing protein [Thermodesulfobacteriota bacterium]
MYRRISFVSIFFLSFLLFFSNNTCWGERYAPNVHWVFCIDTSGSMKEKGHMDLLELITEKITREFLSPARNIIKTGDRITIFSFDDDVRLEATSLFQTEDDLVLVKKKLHDMNKRLGSLTFISEAVVKGIEFSEKYNEFFSTSALYVFTDGKSEPYSQKLPEKEIEYRKKKDQENLAKISLSGKSNGLNVWLGILKWAAFEDGKSFVKKMGKGGHLVDLTDFNRLSLEQALKNFAQTVRYEIRLSHIKNLDFGTIPYRCSTSYQKNIFLTAQSELDQETPSLKGLVSFDPENPTGIDNNSSVEVRNSANKIVLSFNVTECNILKPGTYRGTLKLFPSFEKFGALIIEPSQFQMELRKTGFLRTYLWKILLGSIILFIVLLYLSNKIRRRLPIKV